MLKESYFQRVRRMTGTCYWVNNPTRAQAEEAIRCGALGCTTNPAYISKIIGLPEERARIETLIDERLAKGLNDTQVMEALQRCLVSELAAIFRPIYEATGGRQGYVSIQGNPLDERVENIISYAEDNATMAPNITPKIPATSDGLIALGKLMGEDIPVNATEIMSIQQFIDVGELYEEASSSKRTRAVAFYSHIAGIFDESLSNYVRDNGVDIDSDYLYEAGLSVARKIDQVRRERGYAIRYINGGARGLHHFTEFVGAEGNITINWTGTSEQLLQANPPVIERFSGHTRDTVIEALFAKLPDYRRAYCIGGLKREDYETFAPVEHFRNSFVKGWTTVINLIAERRRVLGAE